MAKVVCVLYDDPVTGYPKSYPRDGLPKIEKYPDGQTLPTPEGIDFTPGTLLGSVSGELGLRKYLESHGHQLVVFRIEDRAYGSKFQTQGNDLGTEEFGNRQHRHVAAMLQLERQCYEWMDVAKSPEAGENNAHALPLQCKCGR